MYDFVSYSEIYPVPSNVSNLLLVWDKEEISKGEGKRRKVMVKTVCGEAGWAWTSVYVCNWYMQMLLQLKKIFFWKGIQVSCYLEDIPDTYKQYATIYFVKFLFWIQQQATGTFSIVLIKEQLLNAS